MSTEQQIIDREDTFKYVTRTITMACGCKRKAKLPVNLEEQEKEREFFRKCTMCRKHYN